MKSSVLRNLIREEVRKILKESHDEHENYMFFQNLHTIKRMVEKMMDMDPAQVDQLLSSGHGWAVDHIATSTDDITEVAQWLCNELNEEMPAPMHMLKEKTADEIKNDKDTVEAQILAAKAKLKSATAEVKVAKEQIAALTKKKAEMSAQKPSIEI